MSVGWVKDDNLFSTKKTVPLHFDVEWAREGRKGNYKISQLISFN